MAKQASGQFITHRHCGFFASGQWQGAGDGRQQVVEFKRFCKVVSGAAFHCLYGGAGITVSGNHDHRQSCVKLAYTVQRGQAIDAR
ncbi:hypothetical protein D3C71_2022750 [compost metagenome]